MYKETGGVREYLRNFAIQSRTLMERRPGFGRQRRDGGVTRNFNSELLYKNTNRGRATRKKQAGARRGFLQWRIMREDHGKKDGPHLHFTLSRVDTSNDKVTAGKWAGGDVE